MPTHSAASRTPRLRLLRGALRRSAARWSLLRGESSCAADKRQLIDDIRELNPTATVRFLVQFNRAALHDYRTHLRAVIDRREPDEAAAATEVTAEDRAVA